MDLESQAQPWAVVTVWLTVTCWGFQEGSAGLGTCRFWQRKPIGTVSLDFFSQHWNKLEFNKEYLSQDRSKGLCGPHTVRAVVTAPEISNLLEIGWPQPLRKHILVKELWPEFNHTLKHYPWPITRQMSGHYSQLLENSQALWAHKNMDLWLESGILLVWNGSFCIFTFQLRGIIESGQALGQGEDMSPENVAGVPLTLTQIKGLCGAWWALVSSKMVRFKQGSCWWLTAHSKEKNS